LLIATREVALWGGRSSKAEDFRLYICIAGDLNSCDTARGVKNLKIKISGQHDDVADCHAVWPRQHEHHHVRHFAGLQQTSRLFGLLQLLGRPVREECADDGAG
jgi:hypothetical protein